MALHEQKHRSEDGDGIMESSSAQIENHETLSQTIKKHEAGLFSFLYLLIIFCNLPPRSAFSHISI